MERIIVWGTGRRAAMYYSWLYDFYDVVGFVATTDIDKSSVDKINILNMEELDEFPETRIVICTEKTEIEKLLQEFNSVNEKFIARMISIDDLLKEHGNDAYLKYTDRRQLEVIKEVLNATDEEITDYNWVYDRIIQFGLFTFIRQKNWWDIPEGFHWSVYGLQQMPEEFARLCIQLAQMDIKTAAEIGVYRGRTSIFMCAILVRKNPDLKYLMIDIEDRLEDIEYFRVLLPQLEKHVPSTSDDFAGEAFDFVFIDGDHTYEGSMRDWMNIGQHAKEICAFHDIYAHEYDYENGGTVRTWQEVEKITENRTHKLFSIYPDKWMGIGCVINDD